MASEVGVYDVEPKDVLLKVGKQNMISLIMSPSNFYRLQDKIKES